MVVLVVLSLHPSLPLSLFLSSLFLPHRFLFPSSSSLLASCLSVPSFSVLFLSLSLSWFPPILPVSLFPSSLSCLSSSCPSFHFLVIFLAPFIFLFLSVPSYFSFVPLFSLSNLPFSPSLPSLPFSLSFSSYHSLHPSFL